MTDFSTWFNAGWYGGLICCMFAIVTNVLYSALRRRGKTRQLARTTVICVISALLLLPAIIWFNSRFNVQQSQISVFEVISILVYIALFGWVVPLGITGLHCFFSLPRPTSTTALDPASMQSSATMHQTPRYQPGVEVPFVFSEETPWGWLEYYTGSFHGQRLALKRAIITIGRDEECDIWIDDDMASRHHAEVAWDNGRTYLTDCESLNGVLLNKRPVRGTALLEPNDMLQIGTHCFVFVPVEQKEILRAQDDPLSRHTWRSTHDLQTGVSQPVPLIEKVPNIPSPSVQEEMTPETDSVSSPRWDQTAQIDHPAPLPQLPDLSAVLLVLDGELTGHKFVLEHPVITAGRGNECDIVINDASISRQHAQFLHQADGVYVQDLTSRNGTRVNEEPLLSPHLLKPGDIISLGSIHLEYAPVQPTHTTSSPVSTTAPTVLPPLPRTVGGPMPLRLPSKPRH
ncbi:MAG TPA: FHA domain-containing protein [Ktedonobacteraceae bacterium]